MPAQLNPVADRRGLSRRNSGDLLPWADPYIASLFNEARSKPLSQDEANAQDESEFDLCASSSARW